MTPEPTDHIRILHTADWHLGREFHGMGLNRSHEAFFEWLGDQIERLEIDLLIMAGDIFDRALPPLEAIRLFNREIDRLSGLTRVVLIAGNHDSTVRMSHGELLREGICLRSGTGMAGEPVLYDDLPFPFAVYPVPYLDPVTCGPELGVGQTHAEVLGRALDLAREDLAGRDTATRSVAVAHAFATGSETSESERGIVVGGAEDVPGSIFEGFDYTALGHLHRPQQVADRVRYSGSPLCLSFSEAADRKSVTVVDLSPDGSVGVEEIEVPKPFEISRIEGGLEELVGSPEFRKYRDHWLEVTLTDTTPPNAPMDTLRAVFPDVLSLRYSKLGPEQAGREAEALEALSRKQPMELLRQFLVDVRGTEPDEKESEILQQALDHRTGAETRA
jgi:DNA repair protein SbcD/Mre11